MSGRQMSAHARKRVSLEEQMSGLVAAPSTLTIGGERMLEKASTNRWILSTIGRSLLSQVGQTGYRFHRDTSEARSCAGRRGVAMKTIPFHRSNGTFSPTWALHLLRSPNLRRRVLGSTRSRMLSPFSN